MGKRHILLCCEQYYPSIGGVQEVMRQLAERLVGPQLEVTVVTGSHPGREDDAVVNGVRVKSFAISGNLAKGLRGDLASYQAFLSDCAADVLLIKAAQQWTFDAALEVLPRLAAKKFFIPCGFSGLQDPVYRDYFLEMPKWLALFDGLIFYASDYQDISFAREHQLEPIHLLPNGADETEFAELQRSTIRSDLGIPEDHDVLLTVGSLIAAKGHWEVLRAFAAADLKRPATLIINGNSPGQGRYPALRRLLKHLLTGRWPLAWEAAWFGLLKKGGAKRMLLLDLPRQQLSRLYAEADLFVFASHTEYSPLVLFEAAAAGTAILSSTAGNSEEIVGWLGGGELVAAQSDVTSRVAVPELSQKLSAMLASKEQLHERGQTNRRAVFEKGFTWDKIVLRYRQLLGLPADE